MTGDDGRAMGSGLPTVSHMLTHGLVAPAVCMGQVVTGGFKPMAPLDLRVAWQLVRHHVERLVQLKRRLLGDGAARLAYDPRNPSQKQHVHVNLAAPTTSAGLYMLPMFVVLSALVMGVKVSERLGKGLSCSGLRAVMVVHCDGVHEWKAVVVVHSGGVRSCWRLYDAGAARLQRGRVL